MIDSATGNVGSAAALGPLAGLGKARHMPAQEAQAWDNLHVGAKSLHNIPNSVMSMEDKMQTLQQANTGQQSGLAMAKRLTSRLPNGAILRGDVPVQSYISKNMGVPSPAGPAQKKMVNSIFEGHELDETMVSPGNAMQAFGHRSPDVMLREHNRVATLPQEFGPTKRYMQDIRNDRESNLMSHLSGVDYGNSPRVSRHARKHLTNMMNRKITDIGSTGSVPAPARVLTKQAVVGAVLGGLAGSRLPGNKLVNTAVGALAGHGIGAAAKKTKQVIWDEQQAREHQALYGYQPSYSQADQQGTYF